ncbi:oxidoreductase [Stigmatella sp. ncwal1]|uniref:Oxidoreductase n=1 Tax=Stigmatella ashevillensis TaxID=2995309 RepID=A0ABT5DJG1_9BACT|nr:oxidoreductase [Stigmatella ashevillena]MDC0713768.1 oxidoreductase [Stigmatella ashevillena]
MVRGFAVAALCGGFMRGCASGGGNDSGAESAAKDTLELRPEAGLLTALPPRVGLSLKNNSPYVTNRLIREALAPYPRDLDIVTKIGARRGEDGAWLPAFSPQELTQAVHDNLRNLGLEVLDVVNLRLMFSPHGPAEDSVEAPLTVLAGLQQKGLVRHIGLSNVTPTQIAEVRRIAPIVCVQNHYNLVHRADDALIDSLARDGIAYVPFFPLGGFTPLQSSTLSGVAARLGATPMQVALAWLLRRSPNIFLIPGTSAAGPGKDAEAWGLRRNLPVHLAEDRLVPDLAGWRRERWNDEQGAVVTLAPDWACEVLSEETELWDRGHKMLAYGLGRVGHVWLVHPGMRTLEVYLFEGYFWSLLDVWEEQGSVKAAPFEVLAWDLSALWAG